MITGYFTDHGSLFPMRFIGSSCSVSSIVRRTSHKGASCFLFCTKERWKLGVVRMAVSCVPLAVILSERWIYYSTLRAPYFVFASLKSTNAVGGRRGRRGQPAVGCEWALRYRRVAVLHGSGLRDEQGLQGSSRQGLRRRAAQRGGGAGGVRPLLPFGRLHRQGHDRPALHPDGAGLIRFSRQVMPLSCLIVDEVFPL